MMNMDREHVEIPCPSCGREIEAEYRQFWSGMREIQCRRCHAKVKFDATLASHASREASNLDRATKEFDKAFQRMIQEKIEIKTK